MPRKDPNKPKGRMSSYAFFVQTCREEHKKKHPDETVVFAEFTKKCATKWKEMSGKEKHRFEEMAEKDKARYEKDMQHYNPPPGAEGGKGQKRKQKKDPNAPKRALSAFFCFCNVERPAIRKSNPDATVGDVAKILGKKWEKLADKSEYEEMARKDKKRYEQEMAKYKKPKTGGAPVPKVVQQEDDDDEEDDEEEEEEEDDDEEEDDE